MMQKKENKLSSVYFPKSHSNHEKFSSKSFDYSDYSVGSIVNVLVYKFLKLIVLPCS